MLIKDVMTRHVECVSPEDTLQAAARKMRDPDALPGRIHELDMHLPPQIVRLDPVEFRRKNLMRDGGQHTTSQVLRDAGVETVMDLVLDRMNWSRPFDRDTGIVRRGRGFAIAIKTVTTPTTSVAIANFAFSPAVVTVKQGATVTWTNRDEDAHSVAIGGVPASQPLQNGDAFTHSFAQPGTYSYICSIHPYMHGMVVVTAA